ncbi:HNH endonuclease [Rhizobium tumorigenes]|uniref:HNH endonuclease signature motif containing protein n=1 Tax=Rhizobium tumorigenes TaxID=2041385 RepID=A0AAF1KWA5_9HYPH|nr:HNH endonuclease signature motif containing protein [Rhizobium tumorigenes]WFR96294.1 HNH endonuclease signature motif containing protein [Rhizobium tumorigenes]
MKRLDLPEYDPIEVFLECAGNADEPLRTTFADSRPQMQQAVADFDAATASVNWTVLPRVARGNGGVLVAGTLTKDNFKALYTNNMVGTTGAARSIYDKILVAAHGKCPFCAGIGHAKTLDHYLPKAIFPLYSVLPANLVPCCRDCNHGKNSAFPSNPRGQPIHPYLDHARFFDEVWVVASVLQSDPISMEFRPAPPLGWSPDDKARVTKHFHDYDLASRFAIQAGVEVAYLMDLRRRSLRNLPAADFRDYLNDIAGSQAQVANGWKRAMYSALAGDNWFLSHPF